MTVPEGEVIAFLIKKLGIQMQSVQTSSQKQAPPEGVDPFTLMCSILLISFNSVKGLDFTPDGKVIRKGEQVSTPQAVQILGAKPIESSFADEFEDLAPLAVGRSYSQPLGKQKGKGLNIEQQFKALFYAFIWVCADPISAFQREDKIILLKLILDILTKIVKAVQPKELLHLIRHQEAFASIILSALSINDKKLLKQFAQFFLEPRIMALILQKE